MFICIDWFFPAYKAGGPIQSIANLVQHFKDGVSYKIFCSNADLDGQILKEVEFNKWISFNKNTEVLYASSLNFSVSLLQNEVKRLQPDVLFINGIYSWYFNLAPLLFCKAKRKIVSARGMLHPGALSQKKLKKKAYLFFWKIMGLHHHCYFHASNEDEKKYIQKIFGTGCRIFIAQNFPKMFSNSNHPEKKRGELKLITIALISPMKNILDVLQALQLCNQKISYNIYGAVKDKLYWQKCLQQIEKLPGNISVRYNGDVSPANVQAVLENSHIFILPSKSENFGHAIFEALSAEVPIITSHNTPWNNLQQANAGLNVTTKNKEDITSAILFFGSMSQDEFTLWQNGAAQYASSSININEIKEQYALMFNS